MSVETGPGWKMTLGDCIAGMRELSDSSVDVVITDPPYEAEVHGEGRRIRSPGKNQGASVQRRCVASPLPFAAMSEPERAATATEIARVSRRWSLVFCQVEASQRWATALVLSGLDYVRTMVWIKPDGQPQFTGDRPGMGYESIVVAHRQGRKRWNGGGRLGVFGYCKNVTGNKSPHPTTKPLPLMRDLVALFSDEGETVLDPFAGSGSTGVACGMLGRKFLGYELNRDYFDIACRRLRGDEAKPTQPSLFGARP